MVKLVAIAALLAALPGCLKDTYHCDVDSDCDMGVAGRCESNHRCTELDTKCATQRAYTAHSEDDTGVCYDDHVALANLCTGGQPPALREGCAADVCTAMPSCCDLGWTDACVEQAQLRCDLGCETWIAITATKGSKTELWNLQWDGTKFTASTRQDLRGALTWLAPAPGTTRPRLGGIAATSDTFVIEDQLSLPITSRTYEEVSSLDFDRDGRDTLVMASHAPTDTGAGTIEVFKVDTGIARTITTDASQHPSWGDHDGDAFPDVVMGAATRYVMMDNVPGAEHERSLVTNFFGQLVGGATPGAPQVRDLEWNDLDGDGHLDLIAAGSQVRLHLATVPITNLPDASLDCKPLAIPPGSCDGTLAAFAAVAMPTTTAASIVVASFPDRALYRVNVHPGPTTTFDVSPIPLPPCPGCAPFLALVARDLDGDRALDLIAIDANLGVSTALTTKNGAVTTSYAIPTTTTGFTTVALSVAGATP